MPSSFRFFSINFERATAALSSADMAQPILNEWQSAKQDNLDGEQEAVVETKSMSLL